MKALTIKQPFASWILDGSKTIELRTWSTHYRGEIAIHAGKAWHPIGRDAVVGQWEAGLAEHPRDRGAWPIGKVIAVAILVDVRKATRVDADRACVPYDWIRANSMAWVLEDVRPTVQRAVNGALGLWEISSRLVSTFR